jgi:hypothetical protein
MNVKQDMPDRGALALSPERAAETIGLKPPTLDKDRREGHLGIPFVKAGRRVLYRLADLQDWLKEHRIEPRVNPCSALNPKEGGQK